MKGVALTARDWHGYLYTSARVVSQRHLTNTDSHTPVRLCNESHYEMPAVSEWQAWEGVPSIGYHYTEDLHAARAQLLLSNRSPRVILGTAAACDMVALRYQCLKGVNGISSQCVIREFPDHDREAIEEFLTRLPINIEWCGEGIPSLTQ